MSSFMECPDGHKCENNSICTENPYDEGAFYCDCDAAFYNQAYAGLYCEHSATSYCTFNKEVSEVSFCTNGGECKVQVSAESAHLGCDCPPAFEGDHCQFIKGTQPDGWPYDGSHQDPNQFGLPRDSDGSGGLSGAVTAIIVLIALGVVGGVGYFVYRKKRSQGAHSTAKDLGASPDLALEADGGVLKESMRQASSVSSMDGTSVEPTDGAMEDVSIDNVDSKGELI